MAEFNLIKIEGKPLQKLIEVVSAGIGTLYRPRAIRKEAEAKAIEIRLLEGAKTNSEVERRELFATVDERIREKLWAQESRRQENIDRVVGNAGGELSDQNSISEEKVSDDWSTRFFNIVQDISDEQMQSIWGKILAGEVKNPNSYSMRTLEVVRNLSRAEADVFLKFAKLGMYASGTSFVFNPDANEFLKKEYGITFSDRLILEDAGLMSASDLTLKVPYETTAVVFGDYVMRVESEIKGPAVIPIPVLIFTKSGGELLRLVHKDLDLKYMNRFAMHFRPHTSFKVSYSKIISNEGSIISHEQKIISLPTE